MATREAVLDALEPLMRTIGALDLSDPAAATRALNEAHPLQSLGDLHGLLRRARDEGWLCPRTATPTLTYGRIAKAGESTHDLGIEVVDMVGAGPEHTHPNGEIDLCLVEEGQPVFEGCGGGWVVMGRDSHHTPKVDGGRMLIVYFLPGGAIRFGPRR